MKIRYTPRAFADREAIFEYLNRRSPRAAREAKAFIKKHINELRSFPERCPLIRERDARALLVGRYPYIVYYRVLNDENLRPAHPAYLTTPMGGRGLVLGLERGGTPEF